MMKVFAILALLFASSLAAFSKQEYQAAFVDWMHKNSKSYAHDEFSTRFTTFKKNMDFIAEFNSKNTHMKVAMNKFGDLSVSEFSAMFNGLKVPTGYKHETTFQPTNVALPDSWDWNSQGAVTPIKNQGQCGSCWSFSTTGSVEGGHFISTKNLVSLSEQNLVDCSDNEGNQGCNGGLMTQAMQYIIDNNGIDTESSYPYTAQDGTCSYSASNVGAHLQKFSNVASGDEGALQTSVYSGPTSVAIDASQSSFQFYSSGVYSDPDCSSSQLDHGVLATGWGTDSSSGQAYWIVKNSWGTDWGQSGWIWMARNDNNMCGIATMATLPSPYN